MDDVAAVPPGRVIATVEISVRWLEPETEQEAILAYVAWMVDWPGTSCNGSSVIHKLEKHPRALV